MKIRSNFLWSEIQYRLRGLYGSWMEVDKPGGHCDGSILKLFRIKLNQQTKYTFYFVKATSVIINYSIKHIDRDSYLLDFRRFYNSFLEIYKKTNKNNGEK